MEGGALLNTDWDEHNGDFALHRPVRSKSIKLVRALIEFGEDPHLASNDGETSLGISVRSDNIEMVKFFKYLEVSTDTSDYWFAVDMEDIAVEEVLLSSVSDEINNVFEAQKSCAVDS